VPAETGAIRLVDSATSTGGQRQLAGKIRQRFQRGPGAFLDLCAGLGGETRAVLDQGKNLVGFELIGTQAGCGLLEPRPELDERFSHFRKGTGIIRAMRDLGRKLLGLVLKRMSERQVERRFGSRVALRAIFGGMARSFEPDAARGFEGCLQYELTRLATGREPAVWTIEISGRRARARPGPSADPKLKLRLHLADFMKVAAGELDPAIPMLQGRGNVQGSLDLAMRLPAMFGEARAGRGG
jgi:putative sterol carrier protein